MLVQDLAVIVKEGDKVSATVTSIQEYGCLVAINRAQTAILHLSELSHDPMLLKQPMDELLHIGQRFSVEVCDDDDDDDDDSVLMRMRIMDIVSTILMLMMISMVVGSDDKNG